MPVRGSTPVGGAADEADGGTEAAVETLSARPAVAAPPEGGEVVHDNANAQQMEPTTRVEWFMTG